MASRCLSAAGLRFLDRPIPTEDFRRSCVWPTDLDQTSLGFPRSAPSSCDWGGCLLYSGVVVSLPRGVCEPPATAADRSRSACRPTIAVWFSHRVRQLPNYGASAKIHSRSPVQSFPRLSHIDD